jgi:hypothetical protein
MEGPGGQHQTVLPPIDNGAHAHTKGGCDTHPPLVPGRLFVRRRLCHWGAQPSRVVVARTRVAQVARVTGLRRPAIGGPGLVVALNDIVKRVGVTVRMRREVDLGHAARQGIHARDNR